VLADRRVPLIPGAFRNGFGALTLSLLVAAVAAADGPSPAEGLRPAGGFDEAVPDSALCFASLRDVPALRAKLPQLPLFHLFRQPSVQAFLGEPMRETQEGWKALEGKLEGITKEFFDCATGELAVAVLPAGQDAEQTPSFVLVSTVAGRRDDAQALLERIFQDCRSQGYEERRRVRFREHRRILRPRR